MKSMIAYGVAPLLAALLLTACAAPEFKQPAMEVPVAFKEAATPVRTAADGSTWQVAQAAEAQPRGQWWLAFNDPALNALVDEATRANANLAVAAARVKQARAIAGTVPLVLSTGAGAEVRSITGVTVFAGMLGVTLFGLFLTPVFYVALRKLATRGKTKPKPAHDAGIEGVVHA